MKKALWRKHHKWFGIVISVFMLMFVLSGIILNHRELFAGCDVSRKYLPSRYKFERWNGGLMRGTTRLSADSILIYGSDGIWLYRESTGQVEDFNRGLPTAADSLNIRRIVTLPGGQAIAASTTGVYSWDGQNWVKALTADRKITDIEARGDTVVVLTRSGLYVNAGDGIYRKSQIKPSPECDGNVSLFRTVWSLHSGELFGMPGRIFVDIVAVVLLTLTFTGIYIWLGRPGRIKRVNTLWHNRVGAWSIAFTLLLVITGWCLRPPVMVPLALTKTSPVPGSTLDTDNPWDDRLRGIRFDADAGDWIISSADGFFSLESLTSTPHRLTGTPPVSVMGINAWQKAADGQWLCGSFSGLYRWDRKGCKSTDYFTGEKVSDTPGPPFGQHAVAGFSTDIDSEPIIVDYYRGTDLLPQPSSLDYLPMSLWNVALEVHSGRMFMGAVATYIFVFVIGLAAFWCLLSGFKSRFAGG